MPVLKSWSEFCKSLRLLRYVGVRRFLQSLCSRYEIDSKILEENPHCRLHEDITVIGYEEHSIILSSGVRVEAGNVLCLGDDLNGHGKISVGEDSWIGQYNNIRAGGGDICIGSKCLISQFCTLIASNHSMDASQPVIEQPSNESKTGVRLGDDVWLGASVCVMPGVTICDGAVVGAGSVVTKSIPPMEIWAGVPAVKVGSRIK